MLLPALSLAFLLHFSDATTTTCPEVVKDCPSDELYHQRVNETIREVLADLNKTSEAYEFMHNYEDRLHTFVVDLRVALLLDQRLLERLIYIQNKHGENFTAHPDFDKECDEHNIAKLVPVITCPEAVPECPSNVSFHIRVNETIREVLLDINVTTLALHDFISDYEARMHTFMVDLRVAMLKDQRLLERLVLLQKEHGRNFTGHPGFSEWCYVSRVDCPCPGTATVSPPSGNCTNTIDEDCADVTDTGIYDRTTTALPTNGSNETDTVTLPAIATTRETRETDIPAVASERTTQRTTTTKTTKPPSTTTTRATTVTTTTRTTTRPSTTTTTQSTTTKTVTLSPEQIRMRCLPFLNHTCANCTRPQYSEQNYTFVCPDGTSYFENVQTLTCHMEGLVASIVHGNGTRYNGILECKEYGIPPVEPKDIKRCEATCDKSADCRLYKHEEIICTCQLGFMDISADTKRPRGTVCKKCEKMIDVDFVIIYDQSGSMNPHELEILNTFVEDLTEFIETEEGDNRVALISFAEKAKVRVPLTNKTAAINKCLKEPRGISSANTNTALAIYLANKEIYAKLPAKSKRRRVTILLTDGAPSTCNQISKDRTGISIASELPDDPTQHVPTCLKAELITTRKEMTEKYDAQIFVVYIGDDLDENDDKMLKLVQDDESKIIHAEKFEQLRSLVMGQLQKKIC